MLQDGLSVIESVPNDIVYARLMRGKQRDVKSQLPFNHGYDIDTAPPDQLLIKDVKVE